ncbi:hypothetical protein [Leisingera sp. M523]|uniref:hypothetical protein n=1 Tax=Leisingera sp. M523 TaxID=2867013 RepID=UPI0021A3F67B|nr:hypothetical protein [Leisingera sp. M523]UWQ31055.1 hypothetical protein K3557_06700 [Leisingera sp. M523]
MANDILEAKWAETIPDLPDNEPARYFNVVGKYCTAERDYIEITRITVQTDEPGLHCNMRRVCIWNEETLLAEFPFIAAGAVGYV